MRVLFITDNKIKGVGGGCLGSRKYYDALTNYCSKYNHEFKLISLDNDMEEKLSIDIYKNRKIDVLSRLQGHSTYLYYVLKDKLDFILKYHPEIILLGRSRLGFIAKYIKEKSPNTKIITFIDNVELDYVDSYFAKKTSLLGRAAKWLEKITVKRDEIDSIQYSDKLVYLTNRDHKRIESLYGYNDENPIILPVCLPSKQELSLESSIKNIYFIGSLYYDANVDAIENFVHNVWLPYFRDNRNIRLTIAGSKPTLAVKELIKKADNISLIEDFDAVKDFISKKSLMIAPIAKGAGMKVKVADTLSMGLMIAASDEALVGYEEALNLDILNGIIRANTDLEYKDALFLYLNSSHDELEAIEVQNTNIFDRYYSFKRSRELVALVIDQLV